MPVQCWFLLVGTLVAVCGCKRGEPKVAPLRARVISVEAQDSTPRSQEQGGAISPSALVAACTEGLRGAGIEVDLSPREARRGDFRLRLDLQLQHVPKSPDTEERGLLRALCRGRLQAQAAPAALGPPPEMDRFDQEAMAEKVYQGRAPDGAAWAAHARAAARDTAAALGAQLSLLSADQQTLLAALSNKDLDDDLRLVAMRLIGARKDREALPALLALLRHPEMAVRDRAIGTLIEIGDRRAVKALAQSAQFSDTFELGKTLEAVATLGGEEARSYLQFIASGHQSEQIRKEARVALSHLEQREKDGP